MFGRQTQQGAGCGLEMLMCISIFCYAHADSTPQAASRSDVTDLLSLLLGRGGWTTREVVFVGSLQRGADLLW